MKNLITFLSIYLAFSIVHANAQDNAVIPNTGFGIRAGINISNFINGGTGANWDQEFIVAPMGGIYYRMEVAERFSVQPELLYSQRGSRFTPAVLGENREFTDRLHYVHLPIYAQYWIVEGLNVHLGPYASFLLGAGDEGRGGTGLNQDYRNWDVGGSAGLGYEFPFGLNVRANYNIGFLNIAGDQHNQGAITQNGNPLNNQWIQVSVGWTF